MAGLDVAVEMSGLDDPSSRAELLLLSRLPGAMPHP